MADSDSAAMESHPSAFIRHTRTANLRTVPSHSRSSAASSFAIMAHGHIRISLAAHIRYGKTKDYSCSPLDCSHPYSSCASVRSSSPRTRCRGCTSAQAKGIHSYTRRACSLWCRLMDTRPWNCGSHARELFVVLKIILCAHVRSTYLVLYRVLALSL